MIDSPMQMAGQLAAARADVAALRDILAALVHQAGGVVTLTTEDVMNAPRGHDLDVLFDRDFRCHTLRLREDPRA